MKDERVALLRISFAVALAGVLCAYAYFLYPPLRAQFASNYHAHIALEKEKDAIAEIMLDPGLISERITDMQGQLLETRPIKGLTPAGVVDDITRDVDALGLELRSVVLGVPEAPGGAVTDEPQLLSMPVTVHVRASYDGGVRFVASLEKSETATYKIGSFSFEPAPAEDSGDAEDADAAETGDKDADAKTRDGVKGAGAKDAGAESTAGAKEDGAAPEQLLLDWVITVYLLYYG
ncbi:MAG: hypothetical protein LBP30_05955 [Clostridiales Family XIII bacterium]|jgi:hypothetical protein|nr:hypothetical protein [Clostridiales Family XIII bacterium]